MESERISVVKVQDLLLVTVPADPDDHILNTLQEQVLQAMEKYEPKGLVLDIATVMTVDSFFARTITETAQMVELMGGRTVIVGMIPAIAITVTQLGLTLGSASTALNLDQALDMLQSDQDDRHAR